MADRKLSYAPWLAQEHRGLLDFTSPMTIHVLAAWDRLNSKLALAPPNPIWGGGVSMVHSWGTGGFFQPLGG